MRITVVDDEDSSAQKLCEYLHRYEKEFGQKIEFQRFPDGCVHERVQRTVRCDIAYARAEIRSGLASEQRYCK